MISATNLRSQTRHIERAAPRYITVPLDGSEESSRIVPLATRLADGLGAKLSLIGVIAPGNEIDTLELSLDEIAPSLTTEIVVVRSADVPGSILATNARLEGCLCMASHGRGRSAALMGSVSAKVAAQSRRPLMLVGPNVPSDHEFSGSVVACVDGSRPSEAVLPIALAWAAALGRSAAVVTVAEPTPEPIFREPGSGRWDELPETPDQYVGRVARSWGNLDVTVGSDVIFDPVSVSDGVAGYAASCSSALVVAGTHGREGLARIAVGSVAASIVHSAGVPVLLVPHAF